MFNGKRLLLTTFLGSLLGLLCIVGASGRIASNPNFTGDLNIILAALWYNRFVMGLFIGLIGSIAFFSGNKWINSLNVVFRGAISGLLISFAFFFTSQFLDLPTFIAGIVYGIIIDGSATYTCHKVTYFKK